MRVFTCVYQTLFQKKSDKDKLPNDAFLHNFKKNSSNVVLYVFLGTLRSSKTKHVILS